MAAVESSISEKSEVTHQLALTTHTIGASFGQVWRNIAQTHQMERFHQFHILAKGRPLDGRHWNKQYAHPAAGRNIDSQIHFYNCVVEK